MCDYLTPLHLKIEAWHKANPVPGKLTMDKFKTIIIPHQHVLKTLDLDHIKPSDEFRTILAHMKLQYMDMEGSGGSSSKSFSTWIWKGVGEAVPNPLPSRTRSQSFLK
jgi:hypothetical protein